MVGFFAEPDTDEPQPMGDDSGEVDMSEEAMDKFNDKRSEAMSAFSDGDFQVWPLLTHFLAVRFKKKKSPIPRLGFVQ